MHTAQVQTQPSTVGHRAAPLEHLAVELLRSKGSEEELLKEEEVLLIHSPHSTFPSWSCEACSSGDFIFTTEPEDREARISAGLSV